MGQEISGPEYSPENARINLRDILGMLTQRGDGPDGTPQYDAHEVILIAMPDKTLQQAKEQYRKLVIDDEFIDPAPGYLDGLPPMIDQGSVILIMGRLPGPHKEKAMVVFGAGMCLFAQRGGVRLIETKPAPPPRRSERVRGKRADRK